MESVQTKTKGFITIATGDVRYKQLALNLLKSYRYFTKNPMPFAILTDRSDEITRQFDVEVIMENPHNSVLDKLEIYPYLPFDETIFVDADILAYSDLNVLFDLFSDATDVSCLGEIYPKEENKGWFSFDLIPEEYRKRAQYGVDLHGGIYFIRRYGISERVFSEAQEIVPRFYDCRFLVPIALAEPVDEPPLALAMAMNGCKPVSYNRYNLICWWYDKWIKRYHTSMKHPNKDIPAIHWGNKFTETPYYRKQVEQLNLLIEKKKGLMLHDFVSGCRIFWYRLDLLLHGKIVFAEFVMGSHLYYLYHRRKMRKAAKK